MNILERGKRYGSTFICGLVAAFFVAAVIGKWWPDARNMVFAALVLFWLTGFIGVIFRDWRSTEARTFEDPRQWDANQLPGEYRFIRHGITRRGLVKELGEYENVADSGVGRYDLPSGGAIFVFMQQPITDDSLITGVQYYPNYGEVPVFPS